MTRVTFFSICKVRSWPMDYSPLRRYGDQIPLCRELPFCARTLALCAKSSGDCCCFQSISTPRFACRRFCAHAGLPPNRSDWPPFKPALTRKIILQALFARADTGLLSSDGTSVPDMPDSLNAIVGGLHGPTETVRAFNNQPQPRGGSQNCL